MLAALGGYLVIRGTVMLSGYLYVDDFAFRYWADTSALTPEYLFRSYYGHVQPFGMFAGWTLQAVFPGSFTALMVWTLLMQVVTFALLWRIVLRLTGSQLAAFLAFLVPAFSMFGFETGVWWCEITETVPYGLFMMVSIWALVRALEGGPGRWWLWSGLAFLAAMLSISKGFVGLIVLLMVTAALPIGAPRRRGLLAALRLRPFFWAALGAATVAYQVFLRFHAPIARAPDWDLWRAASYARDLFFLNIVSGSAGGPWRWFSAPGETWNGVLVIPRPGVLLGVLSVALFVAALVLVRLYRPNLFAYLLWMTGYAAFITLIAAYGRGGAVVASSGYRYTFDFWIPLALFMGLLFYPVIGEVRPFSALARETASRLRLTRAGFASAAAGLFAASCLVSAVEPSLRWVDSQTKQYVQAAQESMATLPPGAELMPQMTMTDLVHPILMLPFASTEVVFGPDPRIDDFEQITTGGMYGFARDGRAEQQYVGGIESNRDGVCSYDVGPDGVSVPFSETVEEGVAYVEMSYLASADADLDVVIGNRTYAVPVRQGLNNVFFEAQGPARAITVRPAAVEVCIDRVNMGGRYGQDDLRPISPPPVLK
jgi:hypothetical protein